MLGLAEWAGHPDGNGIPGWEQTEEQGIACERALWPWGWT